jgi:uncharacterized protein YjiS (DUF1127 family)
MATYNVKTHPAFGGYELGEENGTFRRLGAKIAGWHRARRAYRETFSELEALSNRELADIGISRSDITAVALNAADAARKA